MAEPPRKRKRVTRACDGCHKRGVKCAPSDRDGICLSCQEYGAACTYERPVKRRGPAASSNKRRATANGMPSNSPRSARQLGHSPSPGDETSPEPTAVPWWPPDIASSETIEMLLDCYHNIVYPIFPFFHWPSFSEKVKRASYMTDRAFCVSVLAVCAIASARIRDGATLHPPSPTPAQGFGNDPISEAFFAAAQAAMPKSLVEAQGFDYLCGNVLLAILCIQNGQSRLMLQFLGNYWTLVSIEGLHLESRWPKDIGPIEMEERRRLFWSTYQLEVYSSIVWGGIIRCRESQTQVAYPTELDDEFMTEANVSATAQPSDHIGWLRGWNFTTDLYRVLEHAVDRLRTKKPADMGSMVALVEAGVLSASNVLDLVRIMYDKLPNRFKETRAVTSDLTEDRFSFQAANIMMTMQTVRMVVLASEEATIEKRCQVAGELLDALVTVPTAYLRAISSPLLHQLAGIGQILGGVIQGPLSQWSFLQVRNVLLAMADLLSSLESNLRFAAGTGERLKEHVSRIDRYMAAAAQERHNQGQIVHTSLPKEVWSSPPNQAEVIASSTVAPRLNWKPYVSPSTAQQQETPSDTANHSPFILVDVHPVDRSLGDTDMFELQLPDELLTDWPLDFGQEGAFDFLSDWFGAYQPQGYGGDEGLETVTLPPGSNI